MEKQANSSIEKALIILETLGKDPYEYTVQMLSKATDINITTMYRILYQLEAHGMVTMNSENKKYKVGPNMYHIGSVYVYNDNYMNILQDILTKISNITQESVGLAVLEGDQIISIVEIDIPRPMKMNDVPGRFFQGNKGNYGKCITAFRDPESINKYLDSHYFEKTYPAVLTEKDELLREYAEIRKQGYSTSVDELGIDVIGTGVPLFDKHGKIRGCVAIAFFRTDGWEKKMMEHKDLLLSYQKEIEKYLP